MAATEIEDQRKDDDDLEKDFFPTSFGDYDLWSAKALDIPHLNPYLKRDADFTHGVNFAVAGATALPAEFLADKNIVNYVTNSSLSVQLDWMWSHFNSICYNDQDCAEKLKNSLFVVGEIGSNDYYYALPQGKTMKDVNGMVFDVVQAIIEGIRNLIAGNVNGTSDPYALVTCDTEKRLRILVYFSASLAAFVCPL
ncbi:acetylajmalan esterase-like [Chenopodium quinoa]|uniref:acetylajmalan esterase-like n=1 Tax=Chenopodium quinoa TaxID=63459 RepID=UPI000B77328E|nr:acetylajmalan esterase-like [Chenopodium quinoa]